MPDFKEIQEKHGEQLQDVEGIDQQFETISSKLGELGYDVIINDKEKAEFVPSSRLGEVVSQRDQFKNQVDELNNQLEELKKGASGNEELENKIQSLIDENSELSSKVQQTQVDAEILTKARDAIDPKDVLLFVNKDKIKVDSKGNIKGIDEEIDRIRQEKPHLFGSKGKGGTDRDSEKNNDGFNMNALIRRAAGRS